MNNELIAKAEEIKKNITAAVEDIRDTATYINVIKDNQDKLELALQGAGHTIYLEKILGNDELEEVNAYVMMMVDAAQEKKEKKLMYLVDPQSLLKDDKKEDVKEAKKPEKPSTETMKAEDESKEEATKAADAKIFTKKNPIPEDQEEEYLRKAYVTEDKKVDDIAAELGVGKHWVYSRISKYNLRAEKTTIPAWDKELVIKMLKDDKTVKDIATYFGVSKKDAYEMMAQDGITPSMYKD